MRPRGTWRAISTRRRRSGLLMRSVWVIRRTRPCKRPRDASDVLRLRPTTWKTAGDASTASRDARPRRSPSSRCRSLTPWGSTPANSIRMKSCRICKKANVHPKQIICYCTNTTAGEIAAAILKGAKTPGGRLPDDRGPDRLHGPLHPVDHEASGSLRTSGEAGGNSSVLRKDVHRMGSWTPG